MTMLEKHHSKETKQKMSIAKMGNKNHLGKYQTEETRQKMSEAHTGEKSHFYGKHPSMEKNPNWKGGIKKNSNGYILVKLSKNDRYFPMTKIDGYVRLHRLVMAKSLGRCLKPEEVVHHVDGNLENNKAENLKLFKNNGKHTSLHHKLRKE